MKLLRGDVSDFRIFILYFKYNTCVKQVIRQSERKGFIIREKQ